MTSLSKKQIEEAMKEILVYCLDNPAPFIRYNNLLPMPKPLHPKSNYQKLHQLKKRYSKESWKTLIKKHKNNAHDISLLEFEFSWKQAAVPITIWGHK